MTNIYNFVKNNRVITFFAFQLSQAMHHGYSPASQTGLYKSYLAVILILMVSNVARLLTAFLIFGDKPSLYMFKYEPLGIFILILFVLFGGPIFEELFGLRSFALPKLLEKYTPLNSSIIVGFFFGA